MHAYSADQFSSLSGDNHQIIDTRPSEIFAQGFIPGSIFLGTEGALGEWAALILEGFSNFILVAQPGEEENAAARLQQAGYTVSGYLKGGFESWQTAKKPIDLLITIETDELMMDIPFDPHLQVLDVRHIGEYNQAHLQNALSLPLEEMTDIAELANFEENQNLYLLSQHQYRSSIAASLLKKHGFHNLRLIEGGMTAIAQQPKAKIEKTK